MSSLKVLEETKKFLSDYHNWCPDGPFRKADGRLQSCVVRTIGEISRHHCTGMAGPYEFLREASKELGITTGISFYNDGSGVWSGVPDRERWEKIHKILDRAIELAKGVIE